AEGGTEGDGQDEPHDQAALDGHAADRERRNVSSKWKVARRDERRAGCGPDVKGEVRDPEDGHEVQHQRGHDLRDAQVDTCKRGEEDPERACDRGGKDHRADEERPGDTRERERDSARSPCSHEQLPFSAEVPQSQLVADCEGKAGQRQRTRVREHCRGSVRRAYGGLVDRVVDVTSLRDVRLRDGGADGEPSDERDDPIDSGVSTAIDAPNQADAPREHPQAPGARVAVTIAAPEPTSEKLPAIRRPSVSMSTWPAGNSS